MVIPDRRRNKGWGYNAFITLVSLASILCIVVITHTYIRFLFPPALPYAYTTPSRAGPPPTLCPGATLSYPATIQVTRAPVVIHLYRTIYSLDSDQTAVFGSDSVIVIHERNHQVTRIFEVVIPQLPPGNYALVEGAQDNSTRPSTFSIPFGIPQGCTPRPDLVPQLQRPVFTFPQPIPTPQP